MASPSKLDNPQTVDPKNVTKNSKIDKLAHTTQKFDVLPTPDKSVMEMTKELHKSKLMSSI